MIVDLNNKLVTLGNRKCASSTFYNKFLGFTKIKNPLVGKPGGYSAIEYEGKKIELLSYESIFFSQHFKHFNLQQALYFFEKVGIDYSGFTFLIAIREPYSRCISEYKYYLKNAKDEAQLEDRITKGVNEFILGMSRLHENSIDYFGGVNELEAKAITVKIVTVENLDSDLKMVFEELKLFEYIEVFSNDKLPKINNTDGLDLKKEDFILTPLTKKYIYKIFKKDFEFGDYKV